MEKDTKIFERELMMEYGIKYFKEFLKKNQFLKEISFFGK
jgi:hypothetical protein